MVNYLIPPILCLLLATLSGCGTVNSLRMMRANADVEPVWSGPERIRLKSAFLGEKPYIYATVDGQELLFLVDTGARFPILMDTPNVNQLTLTEGYQLSLRGWGEEENSRAFQSSVGHFDLGGVHFENLDVAAIPITQSRYFLRADEAIYDGVIGHDLMKHFTWEFDAKNNAIYISRARYTPEADAQAFELHSFLSKISISGELAFNQQHTAEADFVIDTGSRHYLKLSKAYVDNNDIQIASTHVQAADFGLSGMVEHERVILPSLTLGDIRLSHVKTNLIPSDDEDDWWILGNALLNQFKTVIDYQHEMFYLVPQEDFVTDHNLFGLELRKIRSGEFVVRYVFPSSPAQDFDVQVGDLITQLDNQDARNVSLSDYNDLASVPGEHSVCIEREQRCFTLQVAPIKGYSTL